MIVCYKNENYLVFRMYICELSNSFLGAQRISDNSIKWLYLRDVTIIDGRLPAGLCVYRKTDDEISWLTFECDNIFSYGNDFYDDLEDNNYAALKIYHEYKNNIRKLHGLPVQNLDFLEKYKPEPRETEEERRQKALSDELDEYLRIGEEIEKE